MKYVVAENYLCFMALLEMIIEDSIGIRISQRDLAEEFSVTVPVDYVTDIKNVKYSSVENDYGVQVTEKKLQSFFNKNKLELSVKYIDGIHINELELDERFAKYLKEEKYVIFAHSYGSLYNKENCNNLGHVALLENIIRDGVVQIYDPGPDEAGIKQVNILKIYDAMRIKGGIYIIDKNITYSI